ncbi:MAG: gamma carbonic anhydrase family protein [Myxococcales bacterium]|nr:gamma carbonic anhydrase family protein [Myxococcales bacterium]
MKHILTYRGSSPILAGGVYIASTAVVAGDVTLGEDASIWFGSIVRGDVGFVRIGKRTNIQDLSVIHVSGGRANTTIGDEVTVGHRVILHGCTIEDGCLIGMGAIVLDGAIVGEGSLVGAGAVVTPGTRIPPRSLVLGSPARVVRPVEDDEALMGRAGAAHYVELAREYRQIEAP